MKRDLLRKELSRSKNRMRSIEGENLHCMKQLSIPTGERGCLIEKEIDQCKMKDIGHSCI